MPFFIDWFDSAFLAWFSDRQLSSNAPKSSSPTGGVEAPSHPKGSGRPRMSESAVSAEEQKGGQTDGLDVHTADSVEKTDGYTRPEQLIRAEGLSLNEGEKRKNE